MARTAIALGSNLGDRIANLRAALGGLRQLSTGTIVVAPLYETDPQGCPEDSPSFINTVVEIAWAGKPEDLLEKTRTLEKKLGRIPNPIRNAPRIIDIDILYCGHAVVDVPTLTLPHPRMAQRSFVLMPLAAIRPDFTPTLGGPTTSALLVALPPENSPPVRIQGRDWANGIIDPPAGSSPDPLG